MEFKAVLETRRSIRQFKSELVPEETIREILVMAQLAPSAGNVQAYKVKIVTELEDRKKIMEATMNKQAVFLSAPAVLVVCADTEESGSKYGDRGKSFFGLQDATIFAAYLQLAIAEKGLASVWVGAFLDEEMKKALALPESLRIVAVIPFGEPDGEPRPRERKPLEAILIK